jgi:hypothetical protein
MLWKNAFIDRARYDACLQAYVRKPYQAKSLRLTVSFESEALAGWEYWLSGQSASSFYDNLRRNMFENHDDLIGLVRMIFMPCMRYFYVMCDDILLVYAL